MVQGHSRERHAWPPATGVVVGVLVLAGFLASLAASGALPRPWPVRQPPTAALVTTGGTAGVTAEDAARLLEARAGAARAGDATAWLAPVDPARPALRAAQRAQLEALRTLPVRDFALRLESVHEDAASPGTYLVRARGSWRLAGYDAHAVDFPTTLQVTRRGGRLLITGTGAPGRPVPVFELPGLRTRVVEGALVMGDAPPAVLDDYARLVAQARAVAQRSWGEPTLPPVVVLPRTEEEFARLVGRPVGAVRGVAAVTYGVVRDGDTARGDKIVVNTPACARLTEQGRRVVLTHELVHLLVRATTRHPVPQWLAEGYAVHASYDGMQIDRSAAAPALLAEVRRGRAPTALPADGRFAGATAGTAYDEAWLAVEHLVTVAGQPAVARFYRDLADGMPRDQAWRRLGLTEAGLVEGWRADLRRLAATG